MKRLGSLGRTRRGSVRVVSLLATLLVALLTAGCGLFSGSEGDTEGGGDNAAKSGPLEKDTLNVGVMVGIDCAGAQLAILEDTFAEEGLTIKPVTVKSGADAIPLLEKGELDITFGNWVSFMKAQLGGMDLRFISESYLSTPNSNFAVIAGPNSGINGAADLKDKKVAVNALGNINELVLRAVLEANDVDFSSLELVVLPFPQMAPALQAGQVDAAVTIDPFVTNAQRTMGAHVAFDLTGSGPTENFPLSGFATRADFAKSSPNTVKAFQRALLAGQQLAADRGNIEKALPKFAKMEPATAAIVRIGQFPTTIDPDRLQRVADLLLTYEMIDKELTVEPLVVPTPSGASG